MRRATTRGRSSIPKFSIGATKSSRRAAALRTPPPRRQPGQNKSVVTDAPARDAARARAWAETAWARQVLQERAWAHRLLVLPAWNREELPSKVFSPAARTRAESRARAPGLSMEQ